MADRLPRGGGSGGGHLRWLVDIAQPRTCGFVCPPRVAGPDALRSELFGERRCSCCCAALVRIGRTASHVGALDARGGQYRWYLCRTQRSARPHPGELSPWRARTLPCDLV